MEIQIAATLLLACMAAFQAFEVRKRRKVAERQLALDEKKFAYRKQVDENNHNGEMGKADNV